MALRVDPITGRVVADGSGDDDSSAGAPSSDGEGEDMAGDLDMDSDDSELDDLLAAADGDAAKAAAMLVQQRSSGQPGGAATSRRARFAVNQFFQRRRKRKANGAHGAAGGGAGGGGSAVGIVANDAALRSDPSRMRSTLTFEPLRFTKNKSVPLDHACPPPLTHASVVYVAAAPGAAAAAASASSGTAIVFGGLTAAGAATNDTWLYHEASQTWELVPVPDASPQPDGRCGHCAVVLRDAPPMVGLSASPRRTTRRVLPGGTADTYDPTMLVLFGADHLSGRRFNDVWAFRLADRTWTLLHGGGDVSDGGGGLGFGANESRLSNAGGSGAEPPVARWGAVAGTYDDRVVVYGGESARYEALGDVGMFDFAACQWRRLRRAMAPLPTPRMHPASCVVAEKLVVTGGIGPNGAECPADVTWILEMRTLLWRRVSGEVGAAGAGPMGPHPGRYLSGHRLLPFDDMAVLVGGRVATPGRATASEAHTNVWLLDVPNEHWIALGELPSTAASLRLAAAAAASGGRGHHAQQQPPTETSTWPVATSFSAVCPRVTYSVSSGIDASLTLEALAASGIHLTDEKEAAQYVDALQQSLQSQAAFSGVLSVRGGRPLLSHNVDCIMLGGSIGSHKQPTSDAFLVRFDYELADAAPTSAGALGASAAAAS